MTYISEITNLWVMHKSDSYLRIRELCLNPERILILLT
uniref:Uncharacterized protein n=1 Tax=Arundo donax TaxID=35708 RepID=A0A0A9HL69_ARUDO